MAHGTSARGITGYLVLAVFAGLFRRLAEERRSTTFLVHLSPVLGRLLDDGTAGGLYAIPVEHFLSAPQATAANLALLGIVSVWRVSLMTRVVSIYFGAGVWAALCLVMLFADTVALTILYFTPLPVFNIMGGIPLTQSEQMIQAAALWVGCLGLPTWFIWFIGVCMVWSGGKNWQVPQAEIAACGRIEPSLWCLAGLMILAWGLVLPFTQPEQQLRHDVESELDRGKIAAALQTMSQHDRKDFPPNWDPPPHAAYQDPQPPLLDVVDVILAHGALRGCDLLIWRNWIWD